MAQPIFRRHKGFEDDVQAFNCQPGNSATLTAGNKRRETLGRARSSATIRLSWSIVAILILTNIYTWRISNQHWQHTNTGGNVFENYIPKSATGKFYRSRVLSSIDDPALSSSSTLLLGKGNEVATPQTEDTATKADTLVVYVFSPTDPEYENNLRYFLREGVHDNDGCDYVFVLQSEDEISDNTLPPLPRNGKYVRHTNECFDWGTVGWAIKEGHAQPHLYKYFIVMNSSVRGPFLPPYWPPEVHWTRVLTSRINDEVKLVGPTISCEGTDATDTRAGRRNPHVQSYVVAMDQVGYNVLSRNQSVFKCYEDLRDTIYYAELGSTLAILDAGYTIDSLMLRYQGIDWRNKNNWKCNGGINPYAEDHYDGVSLNPMEVLFVKVKEFMLVANWVGPRQASRYDEWTNTKVPIDIAENAFASQLREHALRHIWATKQLDPTCFDTDYYITKNRDLPHWDEPFLAWHHYVMNGQFEGRPFRLRCDHLLEHDPTNPMMPMLQDDRYIWDRKMEGFM